MVGSAPTLSHIREAVSDAGSPGEALQAAMRVIASNHPHYEWVGVYVLSGNRLHLEAFVGAGTEHTVIPVGKGVCGTAVATRSNQIIEDVRELENYIACSPTVRSEIVVLLWDGDEIVGQIDADCDLVGAFDAVDEALLTEVGDVLAPLARQLVQAR